jgi:hypothetical protein
VSVVRQVPYKGPFTWADLEAMPDDGRRYKIIDGVRIVGPRRDLSTSE